MYRTLRENISITDLVSRASSLNDDDSVKRLMNLIMQFRKVCNHPELFERADVTAPLAFGSFSETANIMRDPDVLEVPYATKSVIEYHVPKLLYRDGGILTSVGENSRAGSDTRNLKGLFNIWTPEHIQRSLSAPREHLPVPPADPLAHSTLHRFRLCLHSRDGPQPGRSQQGSLVARHPPRRPRTRSPQLEPHPAPLGGVSGCLQAC